MEPMSIPRLLFVVTLALLMPVEWAHCVWMGVQPQAQSAAVSPSTGHECCDSAPSEASHSSEPTKQDCPCRFLPSIQPVAAAVEVAPPTTISSLSLNVTAIAVIAPVSTSAEIPPALDVGNPALLPDSGAHGLRAPPASA
jgi:hypothetical protein